MFSPLSLFSVCLAVFLSRTRTVYLSFMSRLHRLSHACQFTHFTVLLLPSLYSSSSLALSLSPSTYLYTLTLFSIYVYFFLPICAPITTTTTTTIFCTMPKQPSKHCWLLRYPAAIVIGSHYSWDLPFNPGYVIGLLSSVQAGLTPQTSAHLAAMQRYHVSTNTAS